MSEPIRVAQILGCMTGYGVERYVMNSYRCMNHDRVQFDFFANDDSTRIPREEIESLGGRVFLIPSYRKLGAYLNVLEGLLRQNGYPIVHAQIGTMSVFSLYAARRVGVPIRIAHCHSTAGPGEWGRNALKYMLRPFSKTFANHYAAVSAHAGGWLFGRQTMARGEVTIFPPMIDLDAYRYDEAVRAQVRKEMGLDGRFVIGHAGRFSYQKNQEFLIDIFQAVHAQKPNALLMLVGDGETMDAVEKKVEALGLRNDVRMLGNRDDVNRLYQAMDVFVLPSRYEGLPAVALEAQAAGLKVVASTRVTTDTKVRDDMAYLDLAAGAESWAREILKENTAERTYAEDFSPFDMVVQAKRMEAYYLGLIHEREADSR